MAKIDAKNRAIFTTSHFVKIMKLLILRKKDRKITEIYRIYIHTQIEYSFVPSYTKFVFFKRMSPTDLGW